MTAVKNQMWLWHAAVILRLWKTMAAVTILRDELPELKIRVVNVVDLFKTGDRPQASARIK